MKTAKQHNLEAGVGFFESRDFSLEKVKEKACKLRRRLSKTERRMLRELEREALEGYSHD